MNTLAHTMSIVDSSADRSECLRLGDPDILARPDGALLCSYPVTVIDGGGDGHGDGDGAERVKGQTWARFAVSHDGGHSWERLAEMSDIPFGTLFVHDGRLYLIGQSGARGGLAICTSEDGGAAWSEPVLLFPGQFSGKATAHVVYQQQLYRAYAFTNQQGGRKKGSVVVAGNLQADLLSPQAWRCSNAVDYPGTPPALTRRLDPVQDDHWLEPNVVERGGKLFVLHRTKMDRYVTAGMCGVCDLDDDGKRLHYRFGQFYPMPGGQHKFYIFYDPPSALYWRLATLPTNTFLDQQTADEWGLTVSPGNERRLLMLFYSLDAHNWFQAGCVAMRTSPLESVGFGVPVVVGDDLLVVANALTVRGRQQFDADTVRCHHVRDFRATALDIHPHV